VNAYAAGKTALRQEAVRLQAENKRLRKENDALRRAMALLNALHSAPASCAEHPFNSEAEWCEDCRYGEVADDVRAELWDALDELDLRIQ